MGRSSRLRPATQSQSQLIDIDDGEDNASDFAPDDQSDYSATEVESDEDPRAKQGKGKGRAIAKGKAPARSTILEALDELGGGFDGESNPRVMLISLKGDIFVGANSTTLTRVFIAGALGLNLTVANNVFL